MSNKDTKNALSALQKLENQIDNNINLELSDEIPHEHFTDLNVEKNDNGKSRVWVMLLYPDNEQHGKILETIYTDFVAIGALHDQDVTRDGIKVKDHIHIVLYFTSPVYKSHITQKYDFYPEIDKWVHKRSDLKKQVRYLLHKDTPSKYQYPETYLEGNVQRFQKYFDKDGYESSELVTIINIIRQYEFESLADLILFVCDNGLYSTYRRNAYTVNLLYSEDKMKRRDEKRHDLA